MKEPLIKLLLDTGLEAKEARVYLALLELGEGAVKEVANRSGLKRTTIYPILEGLKKQGLVFQTKSKKRTFFIAEKPTELLRKLQNKAQKFAEHLDLLNTVSNIKPKKPRIFFFDGAEGFKKIWQTLFDSNVKEYLIITDPREMLSFFRKGYITGKIIKEKIKLGIKSRQLIAFSEYAKEVVAKDAVENRKSKIISHIYRLPFTTIIFGDRVALISPFQEDIMIIIESEAFAKTQTSLFEALWNTLP